MKNRKRWSLMLTALVLVGLLGWGALPANAHEGEGEILTIETGWEINPLYEGLIEVEDAPIGSAYAAAPASAAEYVTLEEACIQFRENMEARNESFTIGVITDIANVQTQEAFSAFFYPTKDAMVAAAMAHTGEPTEGDYIGYQYKQISSGASASGSGSYGYVDFEFSVLYYTSAAQEQEMDTAVANLLSSLSLRGKSDYEKIRAIYDYMCENITYDYTNLKDSTHYLKYTAYAALINKTAVCQGYANLFYRLALEAGVDARIIAGIGNGGGHAWNIVELNDLYYNLDATWDAEVIKYYDYEYFLRCDANFVDHTRDAEFTTSSFHAAYPMSETDYTPAEEPEPTECPHTNVATRSEYETYPTCAATGTGYIVVYCTACEEEISREAVIWEKLDHTPVVLEAVAATCTTTGLTEGSRCSACGEVLTAQTEIPMKDHTPETMAAVAATCTTDGLTEGSQCSVCGEVLTAQEVIPMTGHTPETVKGVEATCTTSGLTEGSQCSVCGAVLTAQEVIPMKGHMPVVMDGVAATCTTNGLTEGSQCGVCGEVLTAQEIMPMKGHTPIVLEGVAATCTATGLTEGSICEVCDAVLTEQEVIPAKDHTPETVKGAAATCIATGLTDGSRCSACGEILTAQEVTPIIDHTPDASGACTMCGEIFRMGDADLDGEVSMEDAAQILWDVLFSEEPNAVSDVNGDNVVSEADAVYLIWHILFGEKFPIA